MLETRPFVDMLISNVEELVQDQDQFNKEPLLIHPRFIYPYLPWPDAHSITSCRWMTGLVSYAERNARNSFGYITSAISGAPRTTIEACRLF